MDFRITVDHGDGDAGDEVEELLEVVEDVKGVVGKASTCAADEEMASLGSTRGGFVTDAVLVIGSEVGVIFSDTKIEAADGETSALPGAGNDVVWVDAEAVAAAVTNVVAIAVAAVAAVVIVVADVVDIAAAAVAAVVTVVATVVNIASLEFNNEQTLTPFTVRSPSA